jgi:hypothetical protein
VDTWEIVASSGTYVIKAETARKALFSFEGFCDDFVHSVNRSTPETYTLYADDGEWFTRATSLQNALEEFTQLFPGRTVLAVVCDGMQPKLVLEETD